jgi:hypothetical protein
VTKSDFDDLVGNEFDFYGVYNNCFKLDDKVYEAIEDDSDGWRSSLDCVQVHVADDTEKLIFFGMPVARVVIEKVDENDFEGYKLIDLHDEHCWLRFGTGDYDDWYPFFVFEYSPKEQQSND